MVSGISVGAGNSSAYGDSLCSVSINDVWEEIDPICVLDPDLVTLVPDRLAADG